MQVVSAPTGGTSVKFQFIQADDAALTGNMQVLNSTDDIPIASLPAGTLVPLRRVRSVDSALPKRYAGLRIVNAGAIAAASYLAALGADFHGIGLGRGIRYKAGTAGSIA